MAKKSITGSLFCLLAMSFSLFLFNDVTVEASTEIRRPISTTNPMFIFNLYDGDTPETIDRFYNLLPNDVKQYFCIMIVPGDNKRDTENNRNFIESMLQKCEDLNIPMFVQAESCNTRSNIPQSYYSELFDKYSSFIGLCFAEMSASNLFIDSLDKDYIKRMKKTIDTVSEKGGYFLWQDMAPITTHGFLKAGADEGLFEKFKQHSDNIIIMNKHNGKTKRFITPAAAMGFWLGDYISNWGINAEDWLWKESGFSRPFEKPTKNLISINKDPWKKVFTYPDALFGIDWLQDLTAGATVYSIECPYHGFTSCGVQSLSPAFKQVILPLIRIILNDDIIPDKQEVMEKINSIYHAQKQKPGELEHDEIFKRLYGPTDASIHEWLASTGRYLYVPIFPVLATNDELKEFGTVLQSDNYNDYFPSNYEKVNLFNSMYPPIGKGNSWFVNYNTNWFICNPYENTNITTTFEFPLKTNSCTSLAGSFSPHTFGIVKEKDNGFNIHLSNYKIDAQKDIWDNTDFDADNFCDYVNNKYNVDPTDDELRQSQICIKGATDGKPEILNVEGDNGYNYTTSWDNELKEFTININHNGPIDIEINATGNSLDSTPKNVAIYGHVSTSSHENDDNMDENIIDGNYETRWNAYKTDTTNSWLQVEFDEPVTFNKTVTREFLDRVTGYKLQYWNNYNWVDILVGTTIGESKIDTFNAITSNKVRILFTDTKKDSNGWGNEPSIYEFEIYSEQDNYPKPISSENLALNKTVSTSSDFDNNDYCASKINDGNELSRWNANGNSSNNEWIEIDFGKKTTFNKVLLKEYIDRITGYKLQYYADSCWNDIYTGTTISHYSINQFDPITATKVRVYITSTKEDVYGWGKSPSLYEFKVFND